jgi:hypothetical protein
MNPYYEVVYPKVDENKLRELQAMIKGLPFPTKGASSITRKPILYLRRPGGVNANRNVYGNIYGNNTESWRTQTQSASSSTLHSSPGYIAVQKRNDERRAQSLRDLGRMVRGY